MIQSITGYCALALAKSVCLLPTPWVYSLTRLVGRFVFLFWGKRREVALRNLDIAYGNDLSPKEKEKLVQTTFQNTGLSIADIFLARRTLSQVDKRFSVTNRHLVESILEQDKPIVFVVSHLGSWEYLSFLSHLLNRNWSVIVKTIKNPVINREIDRLRRLMKVTPLPKHRATREALKGLRTTKGVAVLIDQWAGADGVWIDFFGTPTSTTTFPVRLARRTGAVIIPTYCLRQPDSKFEIQVHDPILEDEIASKSDEEIMIKLNRHLEAQIRKYPEQWLWGHKRWKPKPTVTRSDQPQSRIQQKI